MKVCSIRTVELHYCPVVKHNIPVEVTCCEDGSRVRECLNCHKCESTGGCTNRFIQELE